MSRPPSRGTTPLPRRRMLAGVAGLAVATLLAACTAPPSPASSAAPAATAEVTRGDLTTTSTAIGTIGYGATSDLAAGLGGVVTSLPAVGTVVGNGGELVRIDDQPVIRFAGALPAWRDLGPDSTDGTDIRQLEQALVDLGYASGLDLAVDGDWTRVTTAAVKRWQKAVGLEQTGRIPLGRVVFTPSDVRVAALVAAVGNRVGPDTPVLSIGSTTRAIQVQLEAGQANLAPVGAVVELALPTGPTVPGTVAAVETVAPTEEGGESTLRVTVVSDSEELGSLLDGTTVRVRFVTVLAEDVLLIPVDALLAVDGGRYAVERVTGDETERVTVKPGMFSGTSVEVVEGDLEEGDKVVTTP